MQNVYGCDIGSAGFGAWYWISDIPMIRMSFDPSALSNVNISLIDFQLINQLNCHYLYHQL